MTAKKGTSEPARWPAAGIERAGGAWGATEERAASAAAGESLMGGLLLIEPAEPLAQKPLLRLAGPNRRQQPLRQLLVLRILGDGKGLRGHRAGNAVNPDRVEVIGRAGGVAQVGHRRVE